MTCSNSKSVYCIVGCNTSVLIQFGVSVGGPRWLMTDQSVRFTCTKSSRIRIVIHTV